MIRVRRFNVDDITTRRSLGRMAIRHGGRAAGVKPRVERYGQLEAAVPFGEAEPDKLIDPRDYKEIIARCHAEKIFPMYHQQATWGPEGFRWNQNGLNLCWAFGGIAALMDIRAKEGKDTVLLAPTTMGYLVNWRNAGNYLSSLLKGLMEDGVASIAFVPDPLSINPRTFLDGWEEDRANYRLAEAWDTDPRNMIQHCISILATGTPLYVAYTWWGHALEVVGVIWDESQPNNIIWILRNSHNELTFIQIVGNRGIPSEALGFRASRTIIV